MNTKDREIIKERIKKTIGFRTLAERLNIPYPTLKNKLNGYVSIEDALPEKIQKEIEQYMYELTKELDSL